MIVGGGESPGALCRVASFVTFLVFSQFLSEPFTFATVNEDFVPRQNRSELQPRRIRHLANALPPRLKIVETDNGRTLLHQTTEDKDRILIHNRLAKVINNRRIC